MKFLLCLLCCTNVLYSQIIIDHTCTDITHIPQTAIENAKASLHIAYGHTSHGSQITDGMRGLIEFANNGGKGLALPDNIFAFNNGGSNGALDLEEGDGYGDGWLDHDCGYYPNWVEETREYLDDPSHADVNVIMWSWCGQASGYSETQMMDQYLQPMSRLEQDSPDVTFVYMTGHADGSGLSGTLHQRNQQIREYCEQNGKVLFDFYDIECYDPDGHYFGDLYVDDACNYDGGNWAIEWQNSHTQGVDWYDCGSAHSQPLNANQKAYAAWWLWARLGGWTGPVQDETPPTAPQNLIATAVSGTRVDLQWDASEDPESGVSQYRIYSNGQVLSHISATSFSDETCLPDKTYTYRVAAINGAGLESPKSAAVQATTLSDTQSPSVPSGLSATPVSSNQIDVAWHASTDNSAVAGYVIYRDGIEIAQTDATTYSDVSLSPATTYIYQVAAFDPAGNSSDLSASVKATTLDPSNEKNTIHLENENQVNDSFLFADSPNSNYGGEPYRSNIDHFIINFNLPDELKGKRVLEAKLGFYVWNQTNYHENEHLKIYCVTRPWLENEVTWMRAQEDSLWRTSGGDCDLDMPVASILHQFGEEHWDHTFYPEADITPVVQQWVDGTRENCGLLVINDGQTQIGFKASEYNENHRPYLDVTYIDKNATGVEEIQAAKDFILCSNYPNPFNSSTTIQFNVPKEQFVELTIFDVQGHKVRMLISERVQPGVHRVPFKAKNLPTGIYLYTLCTGDDRLTRKMILVK